MRARRFVAWALLMALPVAAVAQQPAPAAPLLAPAPGAPGTAQQAPSATLGAMGGKPSSREVMQTFGLFQSMCFNNTKPLDDKDERLATMLREGKARALTGTELQAANPMGKSGWTFTLGEGEQGKAYMLVQGEFNGQPFCQLQSWHGSSTEMADALKQRLLAMNVALGGQLASNERKIDNNPGMALFITHQLTLPDKTQPTIVTLSTIDTPTPRHSLVFRAAQ